MLLVLLAAAGWMAYRHPELTRAWRARNSIYMAWLASAGLVLLLAPVHDGRYPFFAIAPALILAADASLFLLNLTVGKRAIAWLAAAGCVFCILNMLRVSATHVSGPQQAAWEARSKGYSRILYCGGADGSFIFELRAHDPALLTSVLRCDKLPPEIFQPRAFEDFARRYGVRAIVLEDARPSRWTRFINDPLPSMIFERKWDMQGGEFRGHLSLYRFTDPSPRPEMPASLRIEVFGKDVSRL